MELGILALKTSPQLLLPEKDQREASIVLRQRKVAKGVLLTSTSSYICANLYCNLRLHRKFSGPAKNLLAAYMGFGFLAYLSANTLEWLYFQEKVN